MTHRTRTSDVSETRTALAIDRKEPNRGARGNGEVTGKRQRDIEGMAGQRPAAQG